jgi:transposase-like protein
VFFDTTYCKSRVISQAMVVAVGVASDGRRGVLDIEVGDSENEAFWTSVITSFLRSAPVGWTG